MSVYEEYSIEQLTNAIADITERIESDKRSIQQNTKRRNDLQAELDRRALEAYWKDHPELLRLEVGDKIMMTQSKHKDLPYSVRGGIYAVGEVYDIINVRLKDGILTFVFSMADQGGYTDAYKQKATLKQAQDMRRAYLSSIESETTDG